MSQRQADQSLDTRDYRDEYDSSISVITLDVNIKGTTAAPIPLMSFNRHCGLIYIQ